MDISKHFLSTSKGIGVANFSVYCELMGQAIQLSIDEAKYNRDANAASKHTKQKAMLIQKQKEEDALWQKVEKKSAAQDIGSVYQNADNEIDDRKMGADSSAVVFNPLITAGSSPTPHTGSGGGQNVSVEMEMIGLKSAAASVVKVNVTGNTSRPANIPLHTLSCTAVLSLLTSISARYSSYITTYKSIETYLNSTSNQLSTESVSKTKLRETETTLKRLEISFQILDLIAKIERTEQPELKKKTMNQWVQDNSDWLMTLQAPVEVEKADENHYGFETAKVLADADECFKSLRLLEKLASALMPTEHNAPDTNSPHANKDPNAAVDDHYVYDQNYGPSIQDAMVKFSLCILKLLLFTHMLWLFADVIEGTTTSELPLLQAQCDTC